MNFFSAIAGSFFEAVRTASSGKRVNRSGNSADSKRVITPYTRVSAMRLARWAYANEGYTKGAVNTMARYSAGITSKAATPDDGWNDASDQWWNNAKDIIDISGANCWEELLWHASVSIDVDGDCGMILLKNEWPLIQNIRAHRIANGNTYDYVDNDFFFDGVKLSSNGTNRPVSYRVITDDNGAKFDDVPAESFVFVAERAAADECRSMTNLIHALENIQDLFDIVDFEKMGIKTAIAPGLVHTTNDPEDRLAITTVDTATSIEREKLFAGAIARIRPGEKLEGIQSNRPTTGLPAFCDVLVKPISLGLGLPTSIVWNPESINGAPTRLAVSMANRRFNKRQDVLFNKIEKRVRGWATAKAMKMGELPWNDDWYKYKLVRPASITVDYGREANSNRDDIAAGIRTLEEDAGERGLDWLAMRTQSAMEVEDLIVRAKEISERQSIPFETALGLLRIITPNGNPATLQPQQQQQRNGNGALAPSR